MADENLYPGSRGSISGFDEANIPDTNPNIAITGWSLDELKRFLLNQSDLNFPSAERILQVEQQIRSHINDFNNPHHTTLDQIVGNITTQVLGAITPGTVPDMVPFYSLDAMLELPLGGVVPATYSTTNLYRQTAGGWLSDPSTELEVIGTDYIAGRAGIPLFSALTNVVPVSWWTQTGALQGVTVVDSTDTTLNYPFVFKDVAETPTNGQFGVSIPMTQSLQTTYSCAFFVKPSDVAGTLRMFQPSDQTNYVELYLDTGEISVFSDTMVATVTRYPNGVLRVSVGFTTSMTAADGFLRLVHLDPDQTGDGTRQGSLGRLLFSLSRPQATTSAIGQPAIRDLTQAASTSPLVLNFAALSVPATLPRFIVTMAFDIHRGVKLSPVVDPTILTMGPLVISRDATTMRVSLNGALLFTLDILDGLNVISLSYGPDQMIIKTLDGDRQVVAGTYAPLSTSAVSFGPFGGYLHYAAFYAQEDNKQILENLTNG